MFKRYCWIVGLISAAVLASQIILTRIFAYLIWYHGVFLIISMALLGFAVSGSVATLAGESFRKQADSWIRIFSLAFGLFLLAGIYLPGFIPLEVGTITLGNLFQMRNFSIHFVYWGIAYMLAGMTIVLVLQRERERVHRVYFSSLAGSGAGCLLALGLLYLGPVTALSAAILLVLAATWMIPPPRRNLVFRSVVITLGCVCLLISAGGMPPKWQVAPSKVEFHSLTRQGIRESHWSPISVVQIFNRLGGSSYGDPGLAGHLHTSMPEQKGIIIDAFAQSAFFRWEPPAMESFKFFSDCSTSAAYVLGPRERVLVIGIGGGLDILRALYFNASSVTGVELNGILVDLLRGPYREFTGGLAGRPGVALVKGEGRSYVKHSTDTFDLIQINYTDTWSASASGGLSLAENFLYTSEAIQDYLHHLNPEGILSITRTLLKPPHEMIRVVLTAIQALRELGIENPRRHILVVAAIMGNQPNPHMSATLLVAKRPFSAEEIELVIEEGRGRWVPIVRPDDQALPPLDLVDAPLGGNYFRWAKEKIDEVRGIYASLLHNFPEDTREVDEYHMDVSPLTDNRPFYYFYAHWNNVRNHFFEGLSSFSRSLPAHSSETGGVILLTGLTLALACSLAGIFLPLAVWQMRQKRNDNASGRGKAGFAVYFAALGVGFISVELNLIQKYALFLGHPIYALAIILAGLLILAGIGSFLAERYRMSRRTVLILFPALIALILLLMTVHTFVFRFFAGSSVWMRMVVMLVLLAPLGVLMGMPFPLGLRRAGLTSPTFIPWLWGINGFSSVLGTMAATIIAITWGYHAVSISAVIAYAIAFLAAIFLSRDPDRPR